jgi:TPR repeat protein
VESSKPPPSIRINATCKNVRRQATTDSLSIIPNFAEFNYMTVDEAAKQHNSPGGNLELAYKCFNAHAELGDMKAKYFKAYYIRHKYVKVNMDENERNNLIVELFKEVADSGDEYPEAQLHYGFCLIKGIGVKKNLKEAAVYFTKAE